MSSVGTCTAKKWGTLPKSVVLNKNQLCIAIPTTIRTTIRYARDITRLSCETRVKLHVHVKSEFTKST